MSENIYDLANQLERSIRQLPEYQAVLTVKGEIAADEVASPLFADYISFQGQLQELMQKGQAPDQDLQNCLQELSQKIQGNPLLADYFAKQQQLSVYLADLERIIFAPLKDLI